MGVFKFSPDGPNRIYLSDLTTTDDNLGLWVDDLRFKESAPEITTVSPANNVWLNSHDVTLEWYINTPHTVTTTLQISNTPTFSETIVSNSWPTDPITHTHTVTEDIASLNWQVSTTVFETGQILTTDVMTFGIDTAVPTSTLQAFYQYAPDSYQLIWKGSDELSGIQGYDVAYRPITTTAWTPWLTGTLKTAVTFTTPDSELAYEFLIIAIDNAGNRQPEPLDFPNTQQAIDLPHAIMLPIIS